MIPGILLSSPFTVCLYCQPLRPFLHRTYFLTTLYIDYNPQGKYVFPVPVPRHLKTPCTHGTYFWTTLYPIVLIAKRSTRYRCLPLTPLYIAFIPRRTLGSRYQCRLTSTR